ncbi:MAG: LacI family DNA-binding transcriptional regulator [Planctomycetota bacterium]
MSLRDIARLSNVSISTVSKALSGTGTISAETRKRIQAVADQMRYRPSQAARTLATGRREAIGFVSEEGYGPTQEWTLRTLFGLTRALEERGYHTMLFYREPSEKVLPSMVLRRSVDGVVLDTRWATGLLEHLEEIGIPFVSANALEEVQGDAVFPDDAHAARIATEHLLALGHRRIAYVCARTPHIQWIHAKRWSGFVEAMSRAGLAANPGGGELATYDELVERELARDSRPTALVCFDDEDAGQIMQRLKARGIRVPEDMSVVGQNDMDFCRWLEPALTTVKLPFEEVGAEAGKMVLERIETPERLARQVLLKGELVVRGSTAPPRETWGAYARSGAGKEVVIDS